MLWLLFGQLLEIFRLLFIPTSGHTASDTQFKFSSGEIEAKVKEMGQ